MLLNDDDAKKSAHCGSHKTGVPNCVNVWFYCVTSLAVLSSGSAVEVKTDALVVSLLLVPWCMCCWFFRCKKAIRLLLLTGNGDVACNGIPKFLSLQVCS